MNLLEMATYIIVHLNLLFSENADFYTANF
jgi:hypothetical protein